ncbi:MULTISPECIES: ATP synthase subunit I [Shewanella]|uniref:ATP synthase subunit I n=1 Tax=Shewanella TaxID=22 RepID=UPI0004906515|nr:MULTISPECIES: ATP synthase subunit I [Shewanella]QLE87636.1 F0F1 ATP synthase subunit I [Shewanella sp. Scap07]
MSKVLARRGRWSAYKLVMMQAVMAGGVSIVFFAVWGAQYGLSALAGGAIAVLPNFVFATLAFSYTGASSAGKVMKTFYWGEAVKLLLTIVMFSLVFINMQVVFMPLFVCYTLALIVHWTAPLYFKQS